MKVVTVTPHRNRLPQIRNHLRSLGYQTRKPDQVIVSCHGDTQEAREQITDWLFEYVGGGQIWACGEPSDPWRKPLCVNWAIRRTPEDVDAIITLDVDCILHRRTIEAAERALEEDPRRYLMCPNRSLGKRVDLSGDWEYLDLVKKGHFLDWKGAREGMGPMSMSWGCLQGAMREWWFEVRGLDEEMQYWGSEDHDLAKRANSTGLRWHWLPQRYKLLHQWHPAGQAGVGLELDDDVKVWLKRNHLISRDKLRRKEFIRNHDGWGGLPND